MKPVTLHREADAEIREALEYYEGLRVGMGGEFRRAFEASLQLVVENPQAYAEDAAGIRFCPLRRFPYTLVYVELDGGIWVAAVAHQRRRPHYWARRRPE